MDGPKTICNTLDEINVCNKKHVPDINECWQRVRDLESTSINIDNLAVKTWDDKFHFLFHEGQEIQQSFLELLGDDIEDF